MDDSFFGFNAEIQSLGSGKYEPLESQLISGTDIEDEYDALNDETFGIEVNAEDDWENDHEKFAELEKTNALHDEKPEPSIDQSSLQARLARDVANGKSTFDKNIDGYIGNKSLSPFEPNPDEELEHSITQLVLEDELDDPAIMNMSRSRPFSVNSLFNCKSPPPPAILESNHGSPSTSSIWTSAQGVENFTKDQRFSRLFNNMPSLNMANDPKLEDPCIVGIGTDIRRKSLPADILYKAKTVDEIEREHLNLSPSPLTSRRFEKEVPFLPRTVTFNEMVCEVNSRKRSSPKIISNVSRSPPKADIEETNKSESFSNSSPIHSLSSNRKPPHIPFGLDVGPAGLSPPYGSPPISSAFPHQKLGLNFLVAPYSSHFIPPQVGIQRPQLMARTLNASQPFLGTPLKFPRGFTHVSQIPSAGLLPFSQPQTRFILPFPYFDNAYRRNQPTPLRSNFPPQHQQRSRMQSQQQRNENLTSRPRLPKEENEYDNLMTQKEKEWLIKIQMMQLHTTNPYLDDYYYTTYMMKKKNEEQKRGGGDHEEPKLVVPEITKTETRTYKPAQYEGSLGKLQAVSVNFPRKIIDVDIVHPEDGDGEVCIGNKELRRFRQILLEIEKLYSVFLIVDDFDKKMGALPQESHEPLEESKRAAISSVYNSLSTAIMSEEKFVQIMTIRKGRNLVWRSLPLFSKEKQSLILIAILSNWTLIMKRVNQEEAFDNFGNYYEEIIQEAKLDKLIEMGRAAHNLPETILLELNETHKSHLPSMLQTKLGMTIICSLIERAEMLRNLNNQEFEGKLQEQWSTIVEHLADVCRNINANALAKVSKTYPKMMEHFKQFIQDKNKLEILQKKFNIISSTESSRKKGEGDAT